ncbi:DUF1697 domain-containing protein [Reichenbachiella versicolor]|uniref:DUF1697 domain-containing protein n=1 Tax=Reichenbachiella versicolor TaxID=1821036 RepID=UPI000D6E2E5C|nr:DUF1697 domain-containing protein [Reichenbachiella versicolor]
MDKYVALLRGVNVSGKNKIKMADLREALSRSIIDNVETYIQSGNIIFEADIPAKESEELINLVIKKEFGFDVPVLVLSVETLKTVVECNPFLDKVDDEKKLYVAFLFDYPSTDGVQRLSDADTKGDEYYMDGEILYACYHNGMGKSKMDNNFFENKLKVSVTMRNWKTVNVLAGS